jgi:hypothetical protein
LPDADTSLIVTIVLVVIVAVAPVRISIVVAPGGTKLASLTLSFVDFSTAVTHY